MTLSWISLFSQNANASSSIDCASSKRFELSFFSVGSSTSGLVKVSSNCLEPPLGLISLVFLGGVSLGSLSLLA